MKRNSIFVSMVVLTGSLAMTAAPAWSQVGKGGSGSPSESSGSQGSGASGSLGQTPGQRSTSGGSSTELSTPSQPSGQHRIGQASSDKVKKIQAALKDKGHDPGPADGVMGPKTQKALKDFQSASGITASGRIDTQTAQALGVEASGGAGASSSMKEKRGTPSSSESRTGKDSSASGPGEGGGSGGSSSTGAGESGGSSSGSAGGAGGGK